MPHLALLAIGQGLSQLFGRHDVEEHILHLAVVVPHVLDGQTGQLRPVVPEQRLHDDDPGREDLVDRCVLDDAGPRALLFDHQTDQAFRHGQCVQLFRRTGRRQRVGQTILPHRESDPARHSAGVTNLEVVAMESPFEAVVRRESELVPHVEVGEGVEHRQIRQLRRTEHPSEAVGVTTDTDVADRSVLAPFRRDLEQRLVQQLRLGRRVGSEGQRGRYPVTAGGLVDLQQSPVVDRADRRSVVPRIGKLVPTAAEVGLDQRADLAVDHDLRPGPVEVVLVRPEQRVVDDPLLDLELDVVGTEQAVPLVETLPTGGTETRMFTGPFLVDVTVTQSAFVLNQHDVLHLLPLSVGVF